MGEARLVGTWDGVDDRAISVSNGAAILMNYRAREVNLVLAADTPLDVVVELNGKPVPADSRAADVRAEPSGRTVVRVDCPDMYWLVLGPKVEEHALRLTARGTGLSAYAFTFEPDASVLRDSVALFGAGVASFLAPCIAPLLAGVPGRYRGRGATTPADRCGPC